MYNFGSCKQQKSGLLGRQSVQDWQADSESGSSRAREMAHFQAKGRRARQANEICRLIPRASLCGKLGCLMQNVPLISPRFPGNWLN